jgi:hypothetical protein
MDGTSPGPSTTQVAQKPVIDGFFASIRCHCGSISGSEESKAAGVRFCDGQRKPVIDVCYKDRYWVYYILCAIKEMQNASRIEEIQLIRSVPIFNEQRQGKGDQVSEQS